MAAAQILNLTHAVDYKVTGVGNKLEEVDDKIDAVIKGMPGLLATYSPILIFRVLLDGKDTKVVVDDMKCA
jgi:hypothetical protein